MRALIPLVLPTLIGLALATVGGREIVRRAATAKRPAARHWANEGLYDPTVGFLKRGPRDERTLVLTFDDGPHPESAAPLLDTLKALGVRATFFVVGERVKARPDLVRRMIAEGHEVGNHTATHTRLFDLPAERVGQELKGCEDDVRKATGRAMTLMRPPGMHYTPLVLQVAHAHGYIMVDVNNVAGDYAPNDGLSDLTPEEAAAYGSEPAQIVEKVERQLKPGTIILLHDNPVTLQAVPEIVARARAQGYRFVTTAELMASLPEPVRIVANPPAPK